MSKRIYKLVREDGSILICEALSDEEAFIKNCNLIKARDKYEWRVYKMIPGTPKPPLFKRKNIDLTDPSIEDALLEFLSS